MGKKKDKKKAKEKLKAKDAKKLKKKEKLKNHEKRAKAQKEISATGEWSTAPRIALQVREGFQLSGVDRSSTPGWEGDKASAEAFMAERGEILAELQERFFANAKYGDESKILVILQGLDTSGKGGIARHVLGMVDPQGVHLASFGVPTEEELSHHFLWRIKKELPKAGQIGLFDRSHYEDVLVGLVDDLAPADQIEKRYADINAWEQSLVDDGFTLIKVALMHSNEEQAIRLAERLARPDKYWKYNPGDIDTRKKWDAYQDAFQKMFEKTSTEAAPWYVVPADRKWYARLAITELLVQALVDLDQNWPKPRWKPSTQLRRLAETMTEEQIAKTKVELNGVGEEVEADIAQYVVSVDALAEVGKIDGGARIFEVAKETGAELEELADEVTEKSAE